MRRTVLLPALAVLAASGCDWVTLAKNSLTYGEVARGEAANLAVLDTLVYATRAEDGLAIIDARTGLTLATVAPPAGSESIDDLAVAGELLFVLDARPPGHLSVLSLRQPLQPRLVAPPREVPVGPFSGIAAAAGRCVVSGGTSALTLWHYDSSGTLAGPVATADLGRGQPDVLLTADGRHLLVSTHYWGVSFGLDVVGLDRSGRTLTTLGMLKIPGAGFTAGGAKPANFPIEAALWGVDTVLVAYARGVAVVETADPRRPRLLETLDLGGPAVNVDARAGAAVVTVAGASPALVLLDRGTGPFRVARRFPLAAGARPAGVVVTAGQVIVAARERGVLVYQR